MSKEVMTVRLDTKTINKIKLIGKTLKQHRSAILRKAIKLGLAELEIIYCNSIINNLESKLRS